MPAAVFPQFTPKKYMKRFFANAIVTLLVGNIFAGDIGSMMKEQARSFGGQPGGPPPTPPGLPPVSAAPTAPVPPQLTPAQQALVKLISDLGAAKVTETSEQASQLGFDLASVANAANRPAGPVVNKLAKHLTSALAGKTLTGTPRSRLAVDLQTVLTGINVSGAPVSVAQMDSIIADVPAILKKAGAEDLEAAAVEVDLKAIVEVRNKSAKQFRPKENGGSLASRRCETFSSRAYSPLPMMYLTRSATRLE
jgi:hypothetical protein